MSLYTSSQFASSAASGTDWRDTSRKVLESLEGARTEGDGFNFGFLYISDMLAEDAQSIVNLFRSVLGIENWVGSVGIGICGVGEDLIDVPAISAMIGRFGEGEFCLFPKTDNGPVREDGTPRHDLEHWLKDHEPMLGMVHGNPLEEEDPANTLRQFAGLTGGFLVGGLSSARGKHFQIRGSVVDGPLSGVVFSRGVPVATSISQGCDPIGPAHTVTKADEHTIIELDGRSAVEVFEDDLRSMAIKKIDKDPNEIVLDDPDHIPEEFHTLLKGEMHVAFPVPGTDQNDFLVRNIIGMDPEEGTISVAQHVAHGESVLFVRRDDDTVKSDLSSCLLKLRERVMKETGGFNPKAAIYVSCVARAFSNFGPMEKDKPPVPSGEMALVREIIGDVPLAGFYAGGEISNARLYGYTGVLTLFL